MFTGPMKYWWFHDLLGPYMVKILIFHCFYHHHSNAPHWRFHEILNITLLLPLLFASDFYGPNWWSYENVDIQWVLPSLLDRPTFWLYVIFVVGFGSATRSPNEPPGRPKGTKWVLKAFPGTSNDYPRTPQGCNLLKFCIDVTDCQDHIKSIFCLGSRAGIIIIKKTSVWGLALG